MLAKMLDTVETVRCNVHKELFFQVPVIDFVYEYTWI